MTHIFVNRLTDWLFCPSTERLFLPGCLGPWLCGGWDPYSALFSPCLKSSLGGQQDQHCQPLSHTPIYPHPIMPNTHAYTHTHTHTLTSAALGLLPWVLPELFVSLPHVPLPASLLSISPSIHPSSLLSLSFVPRNSCPAYCLIGIHCTMGSHRGGPLSSVCLWMCTHLCVCFFFG